MEFSELLKTRRENMSLTQEQVANQLCVSEKTISNWETGAILPPTDKCVAIGKVYGIPREMLLRSYNDAVWPVKRIPDKFPTCLFVEPVLSYVTNLNFTPQEVELIRMLEFYDHGEWGSCDEHNSLKKLPYAYVSRVGVSILPQMLRDIEDKLWPAHSSWNPEVFQRLVLDYVIFPHDGSPLSSFSVFELPLKEIVNLAGNSRFKNPEGKTYPYVTDNCHTLAAIKMISRGNEQVCTAKEGVRAHTIDYSVDSEWEGIFHTGYHPIDDQIEKKASPWISYSWEDRDDQRVCIAALTKKGSELLKFYQEHENLFER